MAFSFSEGTNRNWLNTVVMVAVILILVLGTYFLFFAPEPFVEIIVPTELEPISKLSKVEFDHSELTNSEVYQSLRQQVPEAVPGPAGRSNPFAPF